jgi:thiosulfate/3-mercaptopyruvate sulfurtransferase
VDPRATQASGPARVWRLGLVILAAVLLPASPAQLRAQQPGPLVPPDWLQAHLDDPGVVVLHVDARRDGYDEGHIPGARFLNLGALMWDGPDRLGAELRTPEEIETALEAAGVRDGDHVVMYGSNPLGVARAWMTLDVMGFEPVSMLDGGWGAWTREGRRTSLEEPRFDPGSLTLRPREGTLVGSDWIAEHLEDASVTLVDARPDAEYTGADGGMGGRVHAGHIPGAHQMYWEELIESRSEPRLRDRAELERLFRATGVADGGTVVAYCMIGMRASFTYFVARLLGYDARFYDGSWQDWGAKELPYVSGGRPR